jgi:peptide/nickel transport system substrate-binding protein
MQTTTHPKRLLFIVTLLIIVLALTATQCGAAPVQVPAEEAPTQAEATEKPAEAQPAEEEVAEPAEVAATEEAAAEGNNIAESVADSGLAKEVEKGVTVVTDESDVSTPRTKNGGEYRDVSTSDAVSFHPYTTSDSASFAYQGLVWAGALLRLDEKTLEYIPNMAESYTISEDGLTFTFKLRQGLKWSDGQPLTAQDYKWSYDQVIKPENEFPYLEQLEFITSYEALDDDTLQIKIEEVYAPALGQMSGLITPLPKHIWEKLDWSDPEKNPEINHPTVVSGPYKLIEWKRDQFATFEVNENYWYHGAPNITKQTIEIVPDQDIAYQKMKNGESDTAPITPEQLEEARQLENVTVYEWWPVGARWEYIGLNMREGFPTHDINIRHGLNYAIDKELLTEEVMLGQAKRLCSIYAETSWAHNPDVECYNYDPDKAIEAFAKAGYTFQDGQMLDKDGQQLKLKLIYGPNTSKVRELTAVVLQDYLKEIGVEVEIQALEWASFLEAIHATEPDWDMFIGGRGSTPEPHTGSVWWSEENIPDLNSGAYINKEVETLFKEAAGTYDLEVRKEKYGEIQKILAEDASYVFLYYQKAWSGQNNRIKGIEPTILGIGWNSEDWYIEETEQ